MSQLQAEGKLTDAHASLAQRPSPLPSRPRDGRVGALNCSAATASLLSAIQRPGGSSVDAEALYSYEGTFQMQNLILGARPLPV